jgi:hypothetical protein
MAMEFSSGMMAENIKGIGKTENNMEKGSFSIPKKMYGRREYGAKEGGLNGTIPQLNLNFSFLSHIPHTYHLELILKELY